ncbi:hypothetical protein QBC39DRAFT_182917 [Podospora conica]|nr:hypothetical protein QBC39DRAFT_182917 [Schizothecium conicum]
MNTNTQEHPRASTDSLQDEAQKPQQPPVRQQYVYVDKVGTPNPDAQPKKKSKISSFFSKFQSPAVKATNAARDKVLLEQERTGVRKVQVTDTGRSSNAWALS